MTTRVRAARTALLLALGALLTAALPIVRGQQTVATVNGEPVTLAEMMQRLGSLHQGLDDPAAAPSHPDPMLVLQRMIDARLVAQEARRIGLDRDPEVVERIAMSRLALLKAGVARNAVRDVTAADPAAAEKAFRDLVREQNLSLVVFKTEADAKTFAAAAGAGGDFEALATRALASGQAIRREPARFVKVSDLRGEVLEAAGGLEPGRVSAPFVLENGSAVVKSSGVRYPENAAARQQAQETALRARKEARIQEYLDTLRTRNTKLHKDVLAGLDYHAASPGFDALRKDPRVVADITGGKPVTVKDLTAKIEEKFYHGVQQAIDRKRVNPEIPAILDRLMMERVIEVEAKRQGVERQDSFISGMKEQTDSLLFDTFVKKVINPGVTLSDPELTAYYDAHRAEFSVPAMLRLESLAFTRRDDAQAALERLRKGSDMKWLKSNAAGQVKGAEPGSVLVFDGNLLAADGLPAAIRSAVAGAGAGEARFAGAEPGPYYVLMVRESIPAAPRPYQEAREQVAGKVFGDKRKAALDDWIAKLRAGSTIVVHVRPDELRTALGLGGPARR